jgi:hypothetical protein
MAGSFIGCIHTILIIDVLNLLISASASQKEGDDVKKLQLCLGDTTDTAIYQ